MDLSHLTHRARRAYLKKIRRKRIRQKIAQSREESDCSVELNGEVWELAIQRQKEENCKWLERERLAQTEFEARKRAAMVETAIMQIVSTPSTSSSMTTDESTSNVDTTSDLPPWHHPPPPNLLSVDTQLVHQFQATKRAHDICSFFRKTGCCRYGLMCSRQHSYPNVYDGSCTISYFDDETLDTPFDPSILVLRIHHMFVHYYLDAARMKTDALEDQDSGLEFDDSQLLADYHEFYRDVRLELETKWGKISALRTCRNKSAHLRGAVYVEFARGPTATWDAYEACNGRWFAGHQLNCTVVRLAGGWREAICGLFHRGKCPKGDDRCNFLHVFLNPDETVSELQRSLYLQTGELQQKHRDQTRKRMSFEIEEYDSILDQQSYNSDCNLSDHKYKHKTNHQTDHKICTRANQKIIDLTKHHSCIAKSNKELKFREKEKKNKSHKHKK